MSSKFKFSLDGVDATARQFKEIRRALQEMPAFFMDGISRLRERIVSVERDFESLSSEQEQVDGGGSVAVVAPPHGGTGVRDAGENPLSMTPRKPVYCGYGGVLGVDCSRSGSMMSVRDADEFVSVDGLRRVGWKIFLLKDDVNLKLDDAQPVIGLVAEDLENAGLGFFCEYDMGGNLTGVDYVKLSVAALRLGQEAMDEVDELKALVGDLSSRIDRMMETSSRKSDR